MDLDRLIADAKELCRDVARQELTDSPLYIVTQTMLPPMLGATTVCYGYTSPSLDMHLHHCLRDFEGRGPVIVLGNLNIERDFPERTYNKMLGTTLHELAHILERPSLFQPRPYNQRCIRSEAIRIAEAVSQDEEGDGSTPPWTTHESRFMRIAYHLQYRAQRLGWDIEPNEVYSPERFGMSKAAKYALAFEKEAETLLAASFRQICGLPAPPAFKAIYERDQTRWYQSVPKGVAMSLTSLLDSITNRQESRKRSKWSDYKSLVSAICDGKEPGADVVAQTLADNEKTLDGLRHDVLLLERRRKLRAEMDAGPPLESEDRKLAKQIDRAETELKQLVDERKSFQFESKIQLTQFYGIEIDGFAAETAKLSLWLAEHQMNLAFESVFGSARPTLPLHDGGHIVRGNANSDELAASMPD